MKAKILLEEGGEMPKKEFPTSAGYDLKMPEDRIVYHGRQVIPLNFKMELEEGYGAFIFARSGAAAKGVKAWHDSYHSTEGRFEECDVELGLVDCDYRGTCGVIVNNRGNAFFVKKGDSFAQMVILRCENIEFEEVTNLSDETKRGDKGFGA